MILFIFKEADNSNLIISSVIDYAGMETNNQPTEFDVKIEPEVLIQLVITQ